MVTAYQNSNERLLRGMNGGHTDAIITAIRPDRKPLYMGEESHKILQQAFTDLGLTANRTNSIFCTTAIDTAEDWGEVYAIFVKDGWEGTVFSKVGKGYAFNKLEVYADEYLDDGDYYKLVDAIQKLQPTIIRNSSDLTTVLNSRYEDILITGDSYIGLEYHSKLYDEVDKLLNLKNYT